MALENVTIHLHILKYCFKLLLGKLSLKYDINCAIYISKMIKGSTEMASWFGIMIFLCEAVGKGPFLPTSVFICILHFQYNLLKDLWEHILIL